MLLQTIVNLFLIPLVLIGIGIAWVWLSAVLLNWMLFECW